MVSQGPEPWPTNLSFVLDGDISYATFPNNTHEDTFQFRYNVPVYVNLSISNIHHTFVMRAMQGWSGSTVLFDYATYT